VSVQDARHYTQSIPAFAEAFSLIAENSGFEGDHRLELIDDASDMLFKRDGLVSTAEGSVGAMPYAEPDYAARNVFTGDPLNVYFEPDANNTLTSSSFMPVTNDQIVIDGALTAGAYTTEVTITDEGSGQYLADHGAANINTMSIIARNLQGATFVTTDHAPHALTRNVLTLLTMASFAGRYKTKGRSGGQILVEITRPLVSTSHLVELADEGVTAPRVYDVATMTAVEMKWFRTSASKREILCDGPGANVVTHALNIVYTMYPVLWSKVLPAFKPPSIKRAMPIEDDIMRRALGYLDFPQQHLRILLAEAAACMARVHSMADEAMVECIAPIVAVCEVSNFDSGIIGTARRLTASSVAAAQTSGVLTAEANYTRLLNVFTRQRDHTKYERLRHLEELHRQGFNFIKVRPGGAVVPLSGLFSTHEYHMSAKGAPTSTNEESVSASGHAWLDIVESDQPIMRDDVMQTRDLLTSTNRRGVEARQRYTTLRSDTSSYAHSLSTDVNEYVSLDAGSGVKLTNVVVPRATAGCLTALMTWGDAVCALDGTDRSMIMVSSNIVAAREARLVNFATELKRYGVELRLDDRFALGVGNVRRDYAFHTAYQAGMALDMSALGRTVSLKAQRARFFDNLNECLGGGKRFKAFNVYRTLQCVQVRSGIIPRPSVWLTTNIHASVRMYGSATFKVRLDESHKPAPVLVKSSSLDISVQKPGGFSRARLEYGRKAQVFEDADGKKVAVSGDAFDMGVRAYTSVATARNMGYGVDQEVLMQLFDEMTARCSADMLDWLFGGQGTQNHRAIYGHRLNDYPKRTINRFVWHSCTGTILMIAKHIIADDDVDRLSSEYEPVERLRRLMEELPQLDDKMFYVLGLLIGFDCKWANTVSLLHVFCTARALHYNASPPELQAIVGPLMKSGFPVLAHQKCKHPGTTCATHCYGKLMSNQIDCNRCKKKTTCPTCVAMASTFEVTGEGSVKVVKHVPEKYTTRDQVYETKSNDGYEDMADGAQVFEQPPELTAPDKGVRADALNHYRMFKYLLAQGVTPPGRVRLLQDVNRYVNHSETERSYDTTDESASHVGTDYQEGTESGGETPELPPLATKIVTWDEEVAAAEEGEPSPPSPTPTTAVSEVTVINNKRGSTLSQEGVPELKELDNLSEATSEAGSDSTDYPPPPPFATSRTIGATPIPPCGMMGAPESERCRFYNNDPTAPIDKLPPNCRLSREAREDFHHFRLLIPPTKTLSKMLGMTGSGFYHPDEKDDNTLWGKYHWDLTENKCEKGAIHHSVGVCGCLSINKDKKRLASSYLHPHRDKLVKMQLAPQDDTLARKAYGVGNGSLIAYDITNGCLCAGCITYRTFSNNLFIASSIIDIPLWHCDPFEMRNLDLKITGVRDGYWGDLHPHQPAAGYQIAVVCWLANLTGCVLPEKWNSMIYNKLGDADVWRRKGVRDELQTVESLVGKVLLVRAHADKGSLLRTNLLHLVVGCGFLDHTKDSPRPNAPYSPLAQYASFRLSGPCASTVTKGALGKVLQMVPYATMEGKARHDNGTTVTICGSVAGDFNDYKITRVRHPTEPKKWLFEIEVTDAVAPGWRRHVARATGTILCNDGKKKLEEVLGPRVHEVLC